MDEQQTNKYIKCTFLKERNEYYYSAKMYYNCQRKVTVKDIYNVKKKIQINAVILSNHFEL